MINLVQKNNLFQVLYDSLEYNMCSNLNSNFNLISIFGNSVSNYLTAWLRVGTLTIFTNIVNYKI